MGPWDNVDFGFAYSNCEFSVYDGCDVENGPHNEKKQVVGLTNESTRRLRVLEKLLKNKKRSHRQFWAACQCACAESRLLLSTGLV